MKDLVEEIKEINLENDIFGTYNKACSICEFLELDENKELLHKNNLIAIYGSWGIGKSCLMKTISNKLDKNKFNVLWFDTWKYEKDNNLPYSLFKYIGKDNFWDKLKENGAIALKNAYGIFKSLSKGVEINLEVLNIKPGEALDEAEKIDREIIESIEERKCLWEKIEEFEKDFKSIKFKDNKRLIVFLDDLDRCESENIITLISAIKLLLSINDNIIFVLGIDKKAVTLALRNKYNNDINKADEYLEKIFSISFELNNDMKNENFKKYVSDITGLDMEDSKIILELFDKLHFSNARHVKKVLRKYFTIKGYLESKEIDIKNKYSVMFIIYIIILNIFYNDEYKYMVMEDKEKVYNNISLINHDKNGVLQRSRFEIYEKICKVQYDNKKIYDLYEMLVRFSSYKIDKYDLQSLKYLNGEAHFEYGNWKKIFKENICNDFIDFLLTDSDNLEYFFVEEEFDKDKIKKYLMDINSII